MSNFLMQVFVIYLRLATFINEFKDVLFSFFHCEDHKFKDQRNKDMVFALKVYMYFAAAALGP